MADETEKNLREENHMAATVTCSKCHSTDPRQWELVQYTRVNYAGIKITDTTIEVNAQGEIDYGSVLSEYLRCQCGEEIDLSGHRLVYV